MKKLSILLLLLTPGSFWACTVKKPAPSEDFLKAAPFHQRVAILPFTVDFNDDYKKMIAARNPKAAKADYWVETSKIAGVDMQRALFESMAKQVKKGRYEIVIQDFLTTNKGLERAEIPYTQLSSVDKGRLAKQLGVDAILYGESLVNVDYRSFNRGGVTTYLYLYDGRTGKMVWQDEVEQQPNSYSDTPEQLANNTADQLAKSLPYGN